MNYFLRQGLRCPSVISCRMALTSARFSFTTVKGTEASSASSSSVETQPRRVHSTLPGINLGMRVAAPSSQFPATLSDNEPIPESDPRVMWKEHFSAEKQQPYYHNVITNEVTFEVPDGFVTRFPRFYERQGATLDSTGSVVRKVPSSAQQEESSEQSTVTSVTAVPLTPKQKLAAYGAGGVLWYFIVHCASLWSVFFSMYVCHFDLLEIARSYGFHVPLADKSSASSLNNQPFWRTFLIALLLNKLLVPAQIVFAVATAPRVIHYMQPVAIRLAPKIKMFLKNKTGGKE